VSDKRPKHPEQIAIIADIVERAGMRDWRELAAAAGIIESTMGKWVGGHQPLTERNLKALEMACALRQLGADRSKLETEKAPYSVFAALSTQNLTRAFAEAAEEYSDTLPAERRKVLLNAIKEMVEVLLSRIEPTPPEAAAERKTTTYGKIAVAAGMQSLKAEGKLGGESPPSPKAPSQSDSSGEPVAHTHPHSSPPRTPPKPAPK